MTPSSGLRRALCAALAAAALCWGGAAAQSDELQQAAQLVKQGQHERALERLNAYLAARPKDAPARFLKGVVLTELKKTAEAIQLFTELTQEFPELPEPYNNLAVLYAARGDYERARGALEMAIRTHPSYATAHENLGDLYAKMASQAYDKALQLDRGNVSAQAKLNLIRELFSGSGQPAKPPASGRERAPSGSAAPVAAPPKPAPAAARPAGNTEEVLRAVTEWAAAWSRNDVAAYLARYAPDFRTPKGEPRSEWEAQRRARIAKPRRIQVTIEAPRVVFQDAGRALVTFRQHYRSDTLRASSTKTLEMVKSEGTWLIRQERIGG